MKPMKLVYEDQNMKIYARPGTDYSVPHSQDQKKLMPVKPEKEDGR